MYNNPDCEHVFEPISFSGPCWLVHFTHPYTHPKAGGYMELPAREVQQCNQCGTLKVVDSVYAIYSAKKVADGV